MPGKMGCGGGRQWLVISGPWSVGQSLTHYCTAALLHYWTSDAERQRGGKAERMYLTYMHIGI
jgi:hypothetical protein